MTGDSSDRASVERTLARSQAGEQLSTESTHPGDLDHTIAVPAAGTGGAPEAGTGAQPRTIGKYQVRRLLGTGGMGAVYLGFDPQIEREVAIKVLSPALAENATHLDRFLAEARAVGKLNHSHVIGIYDIGQHAGQYHIVMEFARGGSVGELLQQRERLPLEEACRITLAAAQGMQAAHSVGLVHRDIKPENLMLSAAGVVKLVDFGLAKDVGRSSELAMTTAGQLLGTPLYMSPEQINGEQVDPRTDIYSLGATFYHLLTGSAPFPEKSLTQVLLAHLGAQRPDPRQLDASLPAATTAIIATALAVDPEQRYASMQEFANALGQLVGGPATPQESEPSQQPSTSQAATPRVLVVEGSKLRSKVTADVLRKAGYRNVVCCAEPRAAIERAQSDRVDIAIASRQLGDIPGEDALRGIQDATSSQPMCILVSSDPPSKLIVEAPLGNTTAYLKKQASPEEIVRAIYVCTPCPHVRVPFSAGYRDVRLDVVTPAGSIPPTLADSIRQLAILDVTAKAAVEMHQPGARTRDVLIWVLEAPLDDTRLRARLADGHTQNLLKHCATVAVLEPRQHDLRLRGVCREAFLATCQLDFTCAALERILDMAR